MRKLSLALLLPLLLLFAQQGALRHEYSHYAELQASCKKAPPTPDTCASCLAYSHLAGAANADIAPATLLANLTFHFGPALELARADHDALSPRNRGPPSL